MLSWITAQTRTSDGRKNWSALDTDAALAEHFTHVAFAGDGFRDCIDHERTPPCNTGGDRFSLSAHRLQFWNDAGARIALLSYRLNDDLPGDRGASIDAFDFRQWSKTQATICDSAWTAAPTRGSSDVTRDGLAVSSSSEELTSWRLAISRGADDHAGDFQDLQPGIETGSVSLSDIALGAGAASTAWHHGEERTSVAAANVFDRRNPV